MRMWGLAALTLTLTLAQALAWHTLQKPKMALLRLLLCLLAQTTTVLLHCGLLHMCVPQCCVSIFPGQPILNFSNSPPHSTSCNDKHTRASYTSIQTNLLVGTDAVCNKT